MPRTKLRIHPSLVNHVSMLLLSVLSCPVAAQSRYSFTESEMEVYVLLTVLYLVFTLCLGCQLSMYIYQKKTSKIRSEKLEAYERLKAYYRRVDVLTKQCEIERKNLDRTQASLNSANVRIACLRAGLVNKQALLPFRFFEGLQSSEQIKRRYKLLCAAYHPDKGGNHITMRLINEQYMASCYIEHKTESATSI